MATSGFTNFIDCAALKIYALPEAEISVTNGTISKTLGIDDVFEIEAGWKIYVVYIQQKDFGTWTVVSTVGNTDRQKSVVVNGFSLYTVTLILPNEYQPVEYLKSNADAYIPMFDVTYNSCDGADIDFQFNQQYSGNTIYSIFGGRYQDNSVMFELLHWAGKLYVIPPNGGYVNQDLIRHRVKWGNKFNWQVIYDNQIIAATTDSGVRGTFRFDLFNGGHQAGANGSYGGDYRSKSQIYHVNLYQGQEMIRNMWPCYRKSNNVAGMYDVITDTFYTSYNTSTFTTGAPVDTKYSPLYLYNHGNENISITGGFETKNSDSRYQTSGATVTKNKTDILLKNVSNASIAVTTKYKIDVTNYSTLEFIAYRASSAGDTSYYGLSSTGLPDASGAHPLAGSLAAGSWSTDSTNPTIRTLNISSLTGSYYVWFGGLTSNGIYLQQIRMY